MYDPRLYIEDCLSEYFDVVEVFKSHCSTNQLCFRFSNLQKSLIMVCVDLKASCYFDIVCVQGAAWGVLKDYRSC